MGARKKKREFLSLLLSNDQFPLSPLPPPARKMPTEPISTFRGPIPAPPSLKEGGGGGKGGGGRSPPRPQNGSRGGGCFSDRSWRGGGGVSFLTDWNRITTEVTTAFRGLSLALFPLSVSVFVCVCVWWNLLRKKNVLLRSRLTHTCYNSSISVRALAIPEKFRAI